MITNELLQEKWNTQKKMSKEANYDVKKLLDNVEDIVNDMIKEYDIKLKYANFKTK